MYSIAGNAVRSHRWQRVHLGFPVSLLGATGLCRGAGQCYSASQIIECLDGQQILVFIV